MTSFISAVITLTGFWITFGRNVPVRAEVERMIITESPYVKDQSMILKTLHDNDRIMEKVTGLIEKNTAAIHDLRVVIERLASNNHREN